MYNYTIVRYKQVSIQFICHAFLRPKNMYLLQLYNQIMAFLRKQVANLLLLRLYSAELTELTYSNTSATDKLHSSYGTSPLCTRWATLYTLIGNVLLVIRGAHSGPLLTAWLAATKLCTLSYRGYRGSMHATDDYRCILADNRRR
jgi:hypothetical protein